MDLLLESVTLLDQFEPCREQPALDRVLKGGSCSGQESVRISVRLISALLAGYGRGVVSSNCLFSAAKEVVELTLD